jgi:hypothetical protein
MQSRRSLLLPVQGGRPFESVVTSILTEGGFQVRTSPQSSDSGVDFFAERSSIGGRYIVAVQCKNRRASVSDARQWAQLATRSFTQPVDQFWFISVAFTRAAREFLNEQEPHLRAFDIAQLRSHLPELLQQPKRSRNARTRIGRLVHTNYEHIVLTTAALEISINERINHLEETRPNSDDAIAAHKEEISELEKLKREVTNLREAVDHFVSGQTSENDVRRGSLTFAEGVQKWWRKSHSKICDRSFDMSIFAFLMGICHMSGTNPEMAAAVATTFAGGRPAAQALAAILKRHLPIS